MKKYIIAIAFGLMTISAQAEIEKDTVSISQNQIEKFIIDNTTTSSGKPAIKYYALVNGELVFTSKTVVEKVALCKKHNAKCSLAVVRNKKSKSYLRIILN